MHLIGLSEVFMAFKVRKYSPAQWSLIFFASWPWTDTTVKMQLLASLLDLLDLLLFWIFSLYVSVSLRKLCDFICHPVSFYDWTYSSSRHSCWQYRFCHHGFINTLLPTTTSLSHLPWLFKSCELRLFSTWIIQIMARNALIRLECRKRCLWYW